MEHYIHPVTAEYAGEIPVQSRWMKNVTTLHRSLFFKTPGRVIVAVTSFLFFLMAVSGTVLVVKRQQGMRNFFRKVIPDGASSFWHVHLGRLFVVPLILIALSGVYLSLLRFDIIPGFFAAHAVNPEVASDTPELALSDFHIFNNTSISEVRAVDFPFSKDPQDFYILKLRTKEVWVNQFTGEVESEVHFPLIVAFSEAATLIHTGRGSAWWSVVLALASLSVPVFVITGLRMTRKRRAARINNRWGKRESPCYILVATETGTTMQFARDFQNRLAEAGTKSYMDHMNAFAPYPQMKTLVVFAATYGKGEPPANAGKFEDKLRRATLPLPFTYAVVGFNLLGDAIRDVLDPRLRDA